MRRSTLRSTDAIGPAGTLTRRTVIGGLAALAVSPAMSGCGRADRGATTLRTSPLPIVVDLPTPTPGTVALDTVLRRRRSEREFADDPVTDAEVGQLLWAAQGITADWGGRTAPSAGALYPLELYALTPGRVMRYLPEGHRAELVREGDLRPDLVAATLDQESVGQAPLVIAIVGVPARTEGKYGDRATRFVDLEAGHAAQNVLLEAVAVDLAAVPIGGFDDEAVGDVLGLPAGQEPRYLVAVGRRRS